MEIIGVSSKNDPSWVPPSFNHFLPEEKNNRVISIAYSPMKTKIYSC